MASTAPHDTPDRSPIARRVLVALFLASFLLKAGGVGLMNRYLPWNLSAPDTRGTYRPLALGLLHEHQYVIDGDAKVATAVAPGFPVYLAAVYTVFGEEVQPPVLGVLNALMQALTTVLIALIAARAFGARAGVAAGMIHAIDPWNAFWAAFELKEPLAVLLATAAVYAVLRLADGPSLRRAAAAGGLIALAGLTRFPSLGLAAWALAVAAVLAFRAPAPRRAALRWVLVAAIAFAVAMSPWVVRNYRVFGEFLLAKHFVGYYFYVTNGPGIEQQPDTSGYSGYAHAEPQPLRRTPGQSVNNAERELLGRTLRHLVAHPQAALTLVRARIVNMWRPTFAGSSRGNLLVLGVPYIVLMLLAGAGIVLARWTPAAGDGERRARLVVAGVVVFYVLVHVFYWSEIRYRQYVTPFLWVYAGLAAERAAKRLAAASRRPVSVRESNAP